MRLKNFSVILSWNYFPPCPQVATEVDMEQGETMHRIHEAGPRESGTDGVGEGEVEAH